MFLYPLSITLILLALCGKLFNHDRAVYVSVTVFICFAAFFDLIKTLPEGVKAALHLDWAGNVAQTILPWHNLNLGWVIPALIGLVIGLTIHFCRKRRVSEMA